MKNNKFLLFLATLTTVVASSTNVMAFSETNKAQIIYVGDSLASETGSVVSFFTLLTGKAVVHPAYLGGLALCDFTDLKVDPNSAPLRESRLETLVKTKKPHAIVMQFSGNNLTPCTKDTKGNALSGKNLLDKYHADIGNANKIVEAAAIKANIPKPKIIWVLQGPSKNDPNFPMTLNIYYMAAMISHSNFLSDAGYHISMAAYPYEKIAGGRYKWTQYLPCTQFEWDTQMCTKPNAYGGVAKLHKDDDPGHLALDEDGDGQADAKSPAVYRYGMQIAADISKVLGL